MQRTRRTGATARAADTSTVTDRQWWKADGGAEVIHDRCDRSSQERQDQGVQGPGIGKMLARELHIGTVYLHADAVGSMASQGASYFRLLEVPKLQGPTSRASNNGLFVRVEADALDCTGMPC